MKDGRAKGTGEEIVQRYESLDCLRGIAASTVLFGHTLILMTGPSAWVKLVDGKIWSDPILDLYPMRLITSGHQAVILFFVLSGFALYVMFDSSRSKFDNRSVVLVYLLSRWLRLYPVYIFSIGMAISVYLLLDMLGLRYPDNFWLPSATIDVWNIVGHLTLVGFFDVARFNNPIWSIVYEIRISILFPVIYFLVVRFRIYALTVVILAPLVAAVALSVPRLATDVYISETILTIHYSGFFILGALMANVRTELIQWMKGLSTAGIMAALALGLTLYAYGASSSVPFFATCLMDLAAGAGAAVIIALCLSYPVLQKSDLLRWLGTRSYSLYLMHAPCLVVVYKIFVNRVPFYVLCLMMIALSLAVSALTWVLVESRSLWWSRQVRRTKPHPAFAAKVI